MTEQSFCGTDPGTGSLRQRPACPPVVASRRGPKVLASCRSPAGIVGPCQDARTVRQCQEQRSGEPGRCARGSV